MATDQGVGGSNPLTHAEKVLKTSCFQGFFYVKNEEAHTKSSLSVKWLVFQFTRCYTRNKANDCFVSHKRISFPQVGRTGVGEPSESLIYRLLSYILENLAFNLTTFLRKQDFGMIPEWISEIL